MDSYILYHLGSIVVNHSITYAQTELKRLCIPTPDWLKVLTIGNCIDHIDKFYDSFPELKSIIRRCQECDYYTNVFFTVYSEHGNKEVCDCCIDDYYYWESDDNYHDTEESQRKGRGYYHGTSRHDFLKDVDFSEPGLLGLEIETEILPKFDVDTICAEIMECNKVLAEEDGSLDYDYGVEFIFQPLTLSQVVEGSWFHEVITKLKGKALGWDAGKGYGMHISINASQMTRIHVGRFCHFINKHKKMCQQIAGRSDRQGFATFKKEKKLSDYRRFADKYNAVAIRDNKRVEVRIFRSSLNWTRIRRNCEFVDSVREFTKRTKIKHCTLSRYMEFIRRKNRYQNIYVFIKELLDRSKSKKISTKCE